MEVNSITDRSNIFKEHYSAYIFPVTKHPQGFLSSWFPFGWDGGVLMTDYYGAFSTSTSNFPDQIQSAITDTSYKSIFICYITRGKNLRNHLSKMFPTVSAPS